jgi:hypothetical protein
MGASVDRQALHDGSPIAERLARHAGWSIILSRFMPGMRVPVYLAAGAMGVPLVRFVAWMGLAAALWTPVIVLGGGWIMGAMASTVMPTGSSGVGFVLAIFAVFFLVAQGRAILRDDRRRGQWLAKVSLLWRWEFWPTWLFYLPLVPWLGWLALRYRSTTVWTAANPGIPQGGVVGESKYQILKQLPSPWIAESFLIESGPADERWEYFLRMLAEQGWTYPMILKPDASQRGAGLKLAHSLDEARQYLCQNPVPVVAQAYHPGPFEAGIFYYRMPGESRGRIFSITDKVFPSVTGDGRSTLEELIWRHPRYRMQAKRFLTRHRNDAGRVLAKDEPFVLAIAGNHSQGTMFRDGGHLWSQALEERIDEISRVFLGFSIGRYDIRYRDPDLLRAGKDFAIVELNGVTAESTNIYDPSFSILNAYRILARQWALLFEIGNRHRESGIQPVSARDLLESVRRYYREFQVSPLSD